MATPAPVRVIEHTLVGYRRTWRGSAVSTFLTPILYLLAMGVGLGTLVDRGAGDATLEVTYLQFLGPGLLAATAMQTGAGEGAWPIMAGIKWRKSFEATLATPLTVRDLVLGRLGWAAIRLALMALWYAVVLTLFDIAPLGRALLAVPWAIVLGVSFMAPVMAFTASLENDQGLTHLFRFGIVPLFLFSGTFFPVEQLPDPIEPLAALTPLWHGVELIRPTMLGTPRAWPAVAHLSVLVVFLVAGAVLAERQLRRRLRS